jgi:hypothetical protein
MTHRGMFTAACRQEVAVGMPVARPPPAQIPACATNALGSYLGYNVQTRGNIRLKVRGSMLPLIQSYCLPYSFERILQSCLAQCPDPGLLKQVSLGQPPFLHRLSH